MKTTLNVITWITKKVAWAAYNVITAIVGLGAILHLTGTINLVDIVARMVG